MQTIIIVLLFNVTQNRITPCSNGFISIYFGYTSFDNNICTVPDFQFDTLMKLDNGIYLIIKQL
jgi:hypothetical protein